MAYEDTKWHVRLAIIEYMPLLAEQLVSYFMISVICTYISKLPEF